MYSSGGRPFPNAARNLKLLLRSPASWVWVGAVLGIHALISLNGGVDALDFWFKNLGLSRAGFLSGKIWQILSYGLLHGAWWHAGLNALFFLLIGSRIEHMTGRNALSGAAFAGVLGGGVGHLLLGTGLLVGLSGGCVGLLLLLTTLSPESRMFPLPVSARNLGRGILLAELMFALVNPDLGLPVASSLGRMLVEHHMGSCFQVGHACHLGGGLAGWLFGRWMLRPRVTLESLRRERARREAE